MATVTLNYDARNVQARKMLDFILSTGAFKTIEDDKTKAESLLKKRKKIDKIFDNYLIDLSEYKFDRDEANDYD